MTRRSWAAPALLLLLFQAGCDPGGEQAGGDDTETEVAPVAAPTGETAGETAGEPTAGEDAGTESPTGEPAPTAADAAPLLERDVTLYFPSAGDEALVGVPSKIFDTASPVDRAKQIVSGLLEGPDREAAVRGLPKRTRLRQIFVAPDGTAYVDFTADLPASLGGGSMSELLLVYSVVDSLALNISEIRRVAILIEGQEIDSLSGHVDLRRPLPPDRSLIRRG